MTSQPLEILLVEDNPGDAVLTREAMKSNKLVIKLNHVIDGIEALDYLRQKNGYEDQPRPDLILTDLNMPKMDGRELLTIIKSDPALSRIPVVVLTTSAAEQDIVKSYELHASAYVTKPVGFSEFQEIVDQISSFYFTVVKFPSAMPQ